MGTIDGEQLLGDRDQRLRRDLLIEQRLGDVTRAVTKPLALAVEPNVERRVHSVQLFEQLAVEQR